MVDCRVDIGTVEKFLDWNAKRKINCNFFHTVDLSFCFRGHNVTVTSGIVSEE